MPANTPAPRQTVDEAGPDYTAPDENARSEDPGAPVAAPQAAQARDLEPDYEAILAAVSESARGRWFLDEYARRNRTADTTTLLDALDRIERRMDRQADAEDVTRLAALRDVSAAIARTRVEIAGSKSAGTGSSDRPDPGAVLFAAEAEAGRMAAMTLKTAGDRIGVIATALRQYGIPAEHCEILQRYASGISSAAGVMTGLDVMGRALEQIEAAIGDPLPPADADSRSGAAEPDRRAGPGSIALDDIAFVDLDPPGAQSAVPVPPPVQPNRIEPRLPDLIEPDPVEPAAELDAAEPVIIEPDIIEPASVATDDTAGHTPRPISIRPKRRAVRPSDLTGLTFDQKMILFS